MLTARWQAVLDSITASQDKKQTLRARLGRTASLIVPRLYLSDATMVRNENELARLGITHVKSVLEHAPIIADIIPQEHRLHISLADSPVSDILSHLTTTTEFITRALAKNKQNKVLGVSRSATVVIAYLIASSGMCVSEALQHTQAKREIVYPNYGFRRQLETYAEDFVGKRTREESTRFAMIGEYTDEKTPG
ncbi:hypothetical protein C0993_005791 [Termitomyces sp. T159_Od127]|nr:hypothetical protein C0993_005791 [Termitomyces sp. T159_Od127]